MRISFIRIVFREKAINNFDGGFFMSEKMLVTQALDERDLLVKKIADKIAKATIRCIRPSNIDPS